MTCPRCQVENDAGARFCEDCGARLEAACPSCGTLVTPGKKFCRSCGAALTPEPSRFTSPESYTPKHLAEKILTSKAALEGERKQVTVLFADLKGSMELLADRDPEEARKLLDPVLERMMEAVHRYEGTVNQVMGDGIMALFGAPLAHEDHAVRACYAALRMQEAVKRYAEEVRRAHGAAVRIRVGLNSGEVVVRAIGSDLHIDYTAVGQTTHLAARMEQLADPGSVLLTPATLALAEDFIQVRSLGPTPVKGVSEPVEVYELLGATAVRSRFAAHATRGLTKFVGRATEVAQLGEAIELAHDGRGQVVAVVGEPGVGKSRLFWEFVHSHRTAGCLIVEAASVSYGKASSYFPVIELLKSYFRIEDRDDARTVREKVTGKLLSFDRALEAALPALLSLLDVPVEDDQWTRLDPRERRQRTLDGIKRLVLRESQVQPVIVIFEDLHWIDGETQAVLDGLVESLPTARLLLLTNFRPEYRHAWGSKTYYRQVRIDALPTASAEELLETLLGSDSALEPLKRLLSARTEGNPFFLEESVQMLVETKVLAGQPGAYRLTRTPDSLQIPATAQAILAARVDRLSPEDKRLLQAAAVIGKDVPFALLEAIAEGSEDELRQGLARLQAAEFLYETKLFPEVAYTFKHVLTQEVAYASLLLERRKALHERIALAIEELYADRLTEHYGVLAVHFRRAGVPRKALGYLLGAAEKAARTFATREALALYDEAEQVADALGAAVEPDTRIVLHRAKCDLYVLVSDFERAHSESERALSVARATGASLAEGEVLVAMSWATLLSHRFERALDEARQAIDVGERVQAPQVVAGAQLATAFVYEVTGRLEEASAKFDQVLAISRSAGDVTNEAFALVLAAELKGWEAQFEDASRMYAAGIEMARQHNVMVALLEGGFMWGVTLTGQGQYDRALAVFEDGLALAEKVGDENYTPRYLNSLGWLHIECGDLERAKDLNCRAAEGAPRRDDESIANAELNLADIALARADTARAAEILDGVHRRVKHPATSEWMRWRYSMHLFASLADAALERGDVAGARRFIDECLELAIRTRSRKYVVKARRLLGEIALARHEHEDAERALREALAVAQAIGSPTPLWQTHAALGRLYTARGKPEAAHGAYAAARGILERVKTNVHHARLRAALESAEPMRRLIELGAPR
jgi:class 3 adenylate cyclase/tetratricopeptide (TPR) repeat protein